MHKGNISDDDYQKALYVINENQRVKQFSEAIKNDDIEALGDLLYQSHEGLSTKYKVSCKELDFLVEYTMEYDKILGSRMMGGGFGGCTLSLIKDSFIEEFIKEIKQKYFSKFKRKLNPIIANLNQGIQMSLN